MSFEIWIVLIVAASGLSGVIGYLLARRGTPSQADLDDLNQQLSDARQQADTVQSDVNEHFEQSAVLFGKLAKDYREFLEHFSSSAQSLGLSESRARELLEQGYQPLLTHEAELQGAVEEVVSETDRVSEADPTAEDVAAEAPEDVAAEAPEDVAAEAPEADNDDLAKDQQAAVVDVVLTDSASDEDTGDSARPREDPARLQANS